MRAVSSLDSDGSRGKGDNCWIMKDYIHTDIIQRKKPHRLTQRQISHRLCN